MGVGMVHMAAVSHGLRLHTVAPTVWKGALRVPKDKDAARARASALMPAHAHLWVNKSDDGVAEAALIALWAQHAMEKGDFL
jgi:hypothetical protein